MQQFHKISYYLRFWQWEIHVTASILWEQGKYVMFVDVWFTWSVNHKSHAQQILPRSKFIIVKQFGRVVCLLIRGIPWLQDVDLATCDWSVMTTPSHNNAQLDIQLHVSVYRCQETVSLQAIRPGAPDSPMKAHPKTLYCSIRQTVTCISLYECQGTVVSQTIRPGAPDSMAVTTLHTLRL